MAKGRNAVAMSEAEIEGFLAGDMKVQVATVNPDGSPHLTTLFYVLDEGRIAIAALAVGVAQGCVDESVRYAGEREALSARIAALGG